MKTILALLLLIPSLSWGGNKEIFEKGLSEFKNRNYLEAEKIFKELIIPQVSDCDSYCKEAYFYLGGMYLEKLPNFPTDYVKAYEYLNMASVARNKMSNIYLSMLLTTGALEEHLDTGGSYGNPSHKTKVLGLAYLILGVKSGLSEYEANIKIIQKNLDLDSDDLKDAQKLANNFYNCIYLDKGDCSKL